MQENTESSDHQPGIVDRDDHDGANHSAPTESERSSSSRFRRGRNLILVLLLLVAAAVAVPGWRYLSSYEDTDDAQVDGHIIAVSSRINGTIVGVYVVDTQPVREGQLLADIDPSDYVVAIEGARARLGQAQAQGESAKADSQTTLSKVGEDDAAGAARAAGRIVAGGGAARRRVGHRQFQGGPTAPDAAGPTGRYPRRRARPHFQRICRWFGLGVG